MRKIIGCVLLFATTVAMAMDDAVQVPWLEFKSLYAESIERKIREEVTPQPEEKQPMIFSIEEAVYHVTVGEDRAHGQVMVSGKIISGDLSPFRLFTGDLVVQRIIRVQGGTLLNAEAGAEYVHLLPDKSGPFQVIISFLAPVQENSSSRFVAFKIPRALRNAVTVDLPPNTRLLEPPGIEDEEGTYHFSGSNDLCIRFAETDRMNAAELLEINSVSAILFQGQRAFVHTCFIPVLPVPAEFKVVVPPEYSYIATDLNQSWFSRLPEGGFRLTLPRGAQGPFTMSFAVEEDPDAGLFRVALPQIPGNNGMEGCFTILEPEEGTVSVSASDTPMPVTLEKIPDGFRALTAHTRDFSMIPVTSSLSLSVRRYDTVKSAPIVLDTMAFYASVEENGTILSILELNVPPETGTRLSLDAVPNAEIWSLHVNGVKRNVYGSETSWIIPLESGKPTRVSLAYIEKSDRLKIQGQLSARLPRTGIPARHVKVCMALPDRVELLSLDGPVSPAASEWDSVPETISGRRYYFSRSYYSGNGMQLNMAYKEPVGRQ